LSRIQCEVLGIAEKSGSGAAALQKWLVGRWLVAEAAIFLAGGQVADAELRQVFFIALENLHHGQVLVLDLVLPCLHVFGVIVRGADDRAAGMDSNAKLAGGWFVICVTEAVTDARAVGDVADEGDARAWSGPDRGNYSGPKRQSADEAFCIGFHAIQDEGVLVQEGEENDRAGTKTRKVPLSRLETAHQTKTKNGCDGREAGGKQADPGAVDRRAKILRH